MRVAVAATRSPSARGAPNGPPVKELKNVKNLWIRYRAEWVQIIRDGHYNFGSTLEAVLDENFICTDVQYEEMGEDTASSVEPKNPSTRIS